MIDDLRPLIDTLRVSTPKMPVGVAAAPIVDNRALRQGTRPQWFLCVLWRPIKIVRQLRHRLKRA
jgi:hypothetical protein